MKTLIKVNDFELIKNAQGIMLLRSGAVIARFTSDQFLPAVVALLSLTAKNKAISATKVISSFQPTLF